MSDKKESALAVQEKLTYKYASLVTGKGYVGGVVKRAWIVMIRLLGLFTVVEDKGTWPLRCDRPCKSMLCLSAELLFLLYCLSHFKYS
jgi:hypothetical protein